MTTDPLTAAIEAAIWKMYPEAVPSPAVFVRASPRSVAALAAATARSHAAAGPATDRAATSVAASDASANEPGADVAALAGRAALVEEKLQIDAPRLHFTDRADVLDRIREVVRRLAAHAVGFQDVLDDSDRGPWARTVGADITELCTVLDAPAAPVLPASTDRAAVLREAADECDMAGAAYTARAQNDHAAGAFALMETFLRKANEAEYVAAPCDFVACEPGGEPCSTHERLMAHGEGDHELCEPNCGRHVVDVARAAAPAAVAQPDEEA